MTNIRVSIIRYKCIYFKIEILWPHKRLYNQNVQYIYLFRGNIILNFVVMPKFL